MYDPSDITRLFKLVHLMSGSIFMKVAKIFLFEQFYIYHVVLDLYNDEDDLGI